MPSLFCDIQKREIHSERQEEQRIINDLRKTYAAVPNHRCAKRDKVNAAPCFRKSPNPRLEFEDNEPNEQDDIELEADVENVFSFYGSSVSELVC